MRKPQIKQAIVLLSFFSFFLVNSLAVANAPADKPGHPIKEEKGPVILLVTFGSSVKSAQTTFDKIEKRVQAAFPNTEIRWAYTSSIIRKKLAESGMMVNSPEMAMAKLMDEGYSKVAVQSLHLIPGVEFHELQVNTTLFSQMVNGIDRIMVGWPLLSNDTTMDKALKTVLELAVPKNRKADEAIVLMGHGTDHPSNAIYSALMYRAQLLDPNMYVATVEGSPSFDKVKEILLKKKVKKVYLVPFMSVAGDHAMNDMAGSEDDSWKTQLEKAGIQTVPIMKGLAEFDPVVDIWIEQLKIVLAHLN